MRGCSARRCGPAATRQLPVANVAEGWTRTGELRQQFGQVIGREILRDPEPHDPSLSGRATTSRAERFRGIVPDA
jgi:hypothetical protein